MRGIAVLLVVVLSARYGYSQNHFPTSGNVGIGTQTPGALLHIQTNSNLEGMLLNTSTHWLKLFSPSLTPWAYNGITAGGDAGLVFGGPSGFTSGFVIAPHYNGTSGLRVSSAGNVGIGATNPDGFQVNSALASEASAGVNNIRIGSMGDTPRIILDKAGVTPFEIDNCGRFRIFTPGVERFTITATGDVGIGTHTPDAKLSVKGQVHAQEVKVDLNGSVAPDYVFNKDYKLPSLEEVKSYIEKNNHLPEVPSAKEMEANGMNLGEMNLLLLKKVEELTLYLLELKGENTSLQSRVKALESK